MKKLHIPEFAITILKDQSTHYKKAIVRGELAQQSDLRRKKCGLLPD